jgi:glucan phosphoethanolaminetransferase (alkaline phosphatase superfamily)
MSRKRTSLLPRLLVFTVSRYGTYCFTSACYTRHQLAHCTQVVHISLRFCYVTTAVYVLRVNVLQRLQDPLSFLGMAFGIVAFCSSYFPFNFILITCSDDITAVNKLNCWTDMFVSCTHWAQFVHKNSSSSAIYNFRMRFHRIWIRRRNYATFLYTVTPGGATDLQVTNYQPHLRNSTWVS